MSTIKKPATMLDALIPVIALVVMLATSVSFYADNSSYGANQVALILAAAVAVVIGFKNGYSWAEIEKGIVKGVSASLGAVLILLMVGALIGAWILSGTVPTMIYYGLQILSPSIFYAAACIICAIVSVSIGSSWTTAGTVGVALIGIAAGLNMSLPITAGAIISGAYFGDKMSPLSDTTNLAPAVTGTDLFTHIRYMLWTTGPSILIALTLFTLIGLFDEKSPANALELQQAVDILHAQFAISAWTLLPLFLVLFMAYKKYPAFLTLLCGALAGGILATIMQAQAIERSVASSVYRCELVGQTGDFNQCEFVKQYQHEGKTKLSFTLSNDAGNSTNIVIAGAAISQQPQQLQLDDQTVQLDIYQRSRLAITIDAIWRVFFDGYESSIGHENMDNLLSRGGMNSMLNTVFLILCAMTFGAVLETTGMLQRIVEFILSTVKNTGSLFASVIVTCLGTNIIAGDQYIAIVLPGRMFRAEFKKRQLAAKNLSRTLEDSGTITSVLIPWNTCGAYMAGALGVPTLVYLPYCFFNLINPVISFFYAFSNFKIARIHENEPALAS